MEPSLENFGHPYEPYDIQIQFMQDLYQCIENGKIGIFESPTGTGKSLSLICASLTWLRDHKRWEIEGLGGVESGDSEPAWMVEASIRERQRALVDNRKAQEERLDRLAQQEAAQEQSRMVITKRKVCFSRINMKL